MNSNQLLVKMIVDRWNGSIKNVDGLLNVLTDEQLLKEISAGKNRGVYLLGHLIAVHDDMIVLMGLGEKLFPELKSLFIDSADKTVDNIPSAGELRSQWKRQCEALSSKFESMKTEEWFDKHTAISAEDFSKEPHRNKLNILLTRTTHLAYHTGQMALLK